MNTPIDQTGSESKVQDALLPAESKELIACEQIIEAGRKTFVEVGLALTTIRDKRLYRADHATFEEYCRVKWGWQRRHAYRLMEAADVVRSLPDNVSHGTQINERQARELARVEPARRAEVLQEAARNGELTAEKIRSAAAQSPEPSSSAAPFQRAPPIGRKPRDEVERRLVDIVHTVKHHVKNGTWKDFADPARKIPQQLRDAAETITKLTRRQKSGGSRER